MKIKKFFAYIFLILSIIVDYFFITIGAYALERGNGSSTDVPPAFAYLVYFLIFLTTFFIVPFFWLRDKKMDWKWYFIPPIGCFALGIVLSLVIDSMV